jgi:hypothetical protein
MTRVILQVLQQGLTLCKSMRPAYDLPTPTEFGTVFTDVRSRQAFRNIELFMGSLKIVVSLAIILTINVLNSDRESFSMARTPRERLINFSRSVRPIIITGQ